MIAGSQDPLFDDWIDAWLRDPTAEWATNWTLVAARAKSLSEDSPECAAMIRSKLLRTHGPNGLKFRSLYQSDDAPDTTDAEVETRRQIERGIELGSRFIDAGGCLSRAEFDWQMSWNACVLGDAFAVRVWQDIDRLPTSTRWRVVHPARVIAPADKLTDPRFAGGIEVDGNGRPAALWIDHTKLSSGGIWSPPKPERVPWYAPDGAPNVVHKVGLRVPGSRRGLSEFAPIIMQARMLQGVSIAYVATKRVQASHPMLLHVADVEKARQMYRGTRIENLLLAKDHQVEFPAWKFEGADYREFVDVTLRSLCSAWQIPWELVLGDHSAKSGASSRSLWQQHYQMAEREQAEHANSVQRPVDESIVREIDARNSLGLGPDWWANMAGVYQGPPRVMPDPQKEIAWAEGMRALGVSRSTILNRFGEDFRDEVMQDRQDRELVEAQNPQAAEVNPAVQPAGQPAGPAPAPVPAPAPAQSPEPEDEDDPAPQPESSVSHRFAAPPKGEHMMSSSQFAQVMRAINDTARTVVNANITLPEKVIATMQAPSVTVEAPVVHIAAAPAPSVDVHVSAPSVTVMAADPAPAPSVVVNVAPTPVTIENTVEVPSRTVRAVTQTDGSVIMTPQD